MDETDTLIGRCAQDPAAFRRLVELYQGKLFGFLVNLAGRDAADDIFQEVWLRVLKAAPRYEARGLGSGWIFKIARGAALNDLARRRRSAGEPLEDHAAADLADAGPLPMEFLERAETRDKLQAALGALPLEQREIFLLREVAELSFHEISEQLGIPLGTALSRMNYALRKLRGLLREK